MTPDEPTTRTEADKPEAVEHLSTAEQSALEMSGEIEHAAGPAREKLTEKSGNLADIESENGGRS